MKGSLLFLLLIFLSARVRCQTPDWSSQVASIIYGHCSSCHHVGGIAPFPLMSYDDVVNNGISVQQDINASKMPPWPPDPEYNHFRNERVLSADDVATINSWVDQGMAAGDLSIAPTPPEFNGASMMQDIDDTLQFPSYTVQMQADEYRTFVIHSAYTETKYINQVEFLPANNSIVHHVFLFQDTTDVSFDKDQQYPGAGFPGGGLGGFSADAVLLCGWIPGSDVVSLPVNMGFEVPPGADFVISVHYAPGNLGQSDSVRINLKFSSSPVVRTVSDKRLLYYHPPSLINPPFEIPASSVKTFYEKSTVFSEDQSMIALQPHMHLIGRSFKVYMVTSPGDSTNLLYIPDWSFHWQMDYFLTKIMKIPAGAQIFGEGVYDNTINNPYNPTIPPVDVHAGESTLDEMMGCHFSLLDYQAGDEGIILDSSFYAITNTQALMKRSLQLNVFPDPLTGILNFSTDLPDHELRWKLINEVGEDVRTKRENGIPNGIHLTTENVSELPAGIYFLSVLCGDQLANKKVIITK